MLSDQGRTRTQQISRVGGGWGGGVAQRKRAACPELWIPTPSRRRKKRGGTGKGRGGKGKEEEEEEKEEEKEELVTQQIDNQKINNLGQQVGSVGTSACHINLTS